MRSAFPAEFRPDADALRKLWGDCIFAVDANVLLNLYRYSPDTRQELEKSLTSVKDKLFIPHQAAKEFLKNRLNVTAGQAEEYSRAIRELSDLTTKLSNKKKHPFLPESELPAFKALVEKLSGQLDTQRTTLLGRFTTDEILDFVERAFNGKTGAPLTDEEMTSLVAEGEKRYSSDVPPGYRDGKKDGSGDPHRKYGDLIVWKQLIARARSAKKALVFITDDKKEDWWLEQSGRTIGPRTELRDEFIRVVARDFWMYTVDKFMEEAARARNTSVSQAAIAEVIDVRKEVKAESARYLAYRSITRDEMLTRVADSERWASDKEGFLGLNMFIKHYLGSMGYDHATCYEAIHALEEEGLIEIYDHRGEGHERTIKAVRLVHQPAGAPPNHPFADLKVALEEAKKS